MQIRGFRDRIRGDFFCGCLDLSEANYRPKNLLCKFFFGSTLYLPNYQFILIWLIHTTTIYLAPTVCFARLGSLEG